VRHLSDGALRRVHDDRFAGSNREREHLDRCDRCRQRARGVAADATFAATLLARPEAATASTDAALARLRQRITEGAQAGRALTTPPRVAGKR